MQDSSSVTYLCHIIGGRRNLCIDNRAPHYLWVHRMAPRLVGHADIFLVLLRASLLRLSQSSLTDGAARGLVFVKSEEIPPSLFHSAVPSRS